MVLNLFFNNKILTPMKQLSILSFYLEHSVLVIITSKSKSH